MEPFDRKAQTMSKPKKSKRPETRTEQLLALLRRDNGASLADITTATGWLPHSARAALTGLRKKGVAIDKRKMNEITRYFVAGDRRA